MYAAKRGPCDTCITRFCGRPSNFIAGPREKRRALLRHSGDPKQLEGSHYHAWQEPSGDLAGGGNVGISCSSFLIKAARYLAKAFVAPRECSLAAFGPEPERVERPLNCAADFVGKAQRSALGNKSNRRADCVGNRVWRQPAHLRCAGYWEQPSIYVDNPRARSPKRS